MPKIDLSFPLYGALLFLGQYKICLFIFPFGLLSSHIRKELNKHYQVLTAGRNLIFNQTVNKKIRALYKHQTYPK